MRRKPAASLSDSCVAATVAREIAAGCGDSRSMMKARRRKTETGNIYIVKKLPGKRKNILLTGSFYQTL